MSRGQDTPLKICLLSYRSNPHCGGQGVYLKNLARGLKDLGHQVEVVTGPPDPQLDGDIKVHKLPCLDLYDPENLFRTPTPRELSDPVNLMEWLGVSTMGFPEPYTFGLRARRFLRGRLHQYDLVHDNQSLSYGIRSISRFVPTLPTIHHPITRDRKIELQSVRYPWSKIKRWRWYSFIPMQKRVARGFRQIITVSRSAADDIALDFNIPRDRFRVVPNGVMTEVFHPLPEIRRQANRLITTTSADTPLKGLPYLLKAVAEVARQRDVRLTVVGQTPENSSINGLIYDLGIAGLVTFTGRISHQEFARQYARSAVAVTPSLYEGFGLPAAEAMACAVPVISTTGGALPEVVGDAGILVPPADKGALARAITDLLDHPQRSAEMGWVGYRRVKERFTWAKAAEKTVQVYQETISDHGRFSTSAP